MRISFDGKTPPNSAHTDRMTGGAGRDTFVFTEGASIDSLQHQHGNLADTITDFDTATDRISGFAPSVFSGGYREVATNVLDVNFLMDPRHDPNHSALAEFEGRVFFYDEEYDTGYLYNRDVGVVVLEGCGSANDFDASNLI